MERGAIFSPCGVYRYRLWRQWAEGGERQLWIMLNPSTADEMVDDPTIRRCMGFAKRDGFAGIDVVNLYAMRSTNPKALAYAKDPVGPDNLPNIEMALRRDRVAVAAWGAGSKVIDPDEDGVQAVASMAPFGIWCLGWTKGGYPLHPLYQRKDAQLVRWSEPCDPAAFWRPGEPLQ